MTFLSNLKIGAKISILPLLATLGLLIIIGVELFLFQRLEKMISILKRSHIISSHLVRQMEMENDYLHHPDKDLFNSVIVSHNELLNQLKFRKSSKQPHPFYPQLKIVASSYEMLNEMFFEAAKTAQTISNLQYKIRRLFYESDNLAEQKAYEISLLTTRLMIDGVDVSFAKKEYRNSLQQFIGFTSAAMLNTDELMLFSDEKRYLESEKELENRLDFVMKACNALSIATDDPNDKQVWEKIEQIHKRVKIARERIYENWKIIKEQKNSLDTLHFELQDAIKKLAIQANIQFDRIMSDHKMFSMTTAILTLTFLLLSSSLLIRHILAPVKRLTAVIVRMKNKGYDNFVSVNTNDEIGLLANTFNEMIYARKRIDEALRDSEERFRRLAENAKDVIYRMSLPDGKYEYMSPASKDIFGYLPDEFYDAPNLIKTIVHPDWVEYFTEQWKKLLSGDNPPFYEYKIIHKSGQEKWLFQRNVIVLNDQNAPIAVEGIVTDITERKEVEAALRTSESQLSNAMLIAHLGHWEYDVANDIYTFNDHFYELFRTSALQVGGYTMSSAEYTHRFVYPADAFIVQEEIQKSIKVADPHYSRQLEHRIFYFDGSVGYITVQLFIVKDNSGQTIKIYGVNQDITERKEMEIRLKQSQKMEAIGTLAGGIAHDFNNVLSPIVGYAELLKEDLPPDSPLRNFVNQILNSALRSRDLVKQILAFSRQNDQVKKPVELQSIVKETLKLLRASIPTTIDIQQDIDPDCGIVVADSTQIHQIIMNLATNAYHAMEDTGGKLNVKLKQVRLEPDQSVVPELTHGEYALLMVSDTGTGIEDNILNKIFDPYFTTKEPNKGTGFGLSVVQGIVKSHNGSIRVGSEPGKGTEFYVYLPVMPTGKEKNKQIDIEHIQSGTERILLVDDEEAIVLMEKKMLERLGYKVTVKTGSLEALEAFKTNPDEFDLLVTDMTMPHLTGVQLAKEIRNIRPGFPIIICTGFSDQINQEKIKELKIKYYLMKPVVQRELAWAIRNVFDSHQRDR